MESVTPEGVCPEEFRKLQMQVDILQRFLTKTFGSSFLNFCKETKLSLTKAANSVNKPLPQLNKAQQQSMANNVKNAGLSNGSSLKRELEVTVSGNGIKQSSSTVVARRPPPLQQRPAGTSSKNGCSGSLTISAASSSRAGNNVKVTQTARRITEDGDDEEAPDDQQFGFYEDAGEDDVVQFIQPETVFSDDEQGQQANIKNNVGKKRGHAEAFGSTEMQLPDGTECIVIDDQGQVGQEANYLYQQHEEDDVYEQGDENNGEEYYDEEGGYSYSVVEDALDTTDAGKYTTEELHTDGNVTFGNVITAQDTGIQYFQCSFCPSAKVFKHKQSLKEHYLLNHSPTPPAFQCSCGRRFLKQSQLKRHEVVHTAERPFVCPICFKDFTRKDNMTVHMVRNHAEKRHPCPYCPDKIYATTAEVNRHLRMYHSQWSQG